MIKQQQQRTSMPQGTTPLQNSNLQFRQQSQKPINNININHQDFNQQNMKKIFKRASYHVAIAYNIYLKKV
jgi:hypothetical protein